MKPPFPHPGLLLSLLASAIPSFAQAQSPGPNTAAKPTPFESDYPTLAVAAKLNDIIIPRIYFRDTTLRDAIELLNQESRDQDKQSTDPNHKGVHIVLEPGTSRTTVTRATSTSPAGGDQIRITLELSNIPLREALRYVAKLCTLDITYRGDTVLIGPEKPNVTKEYHIPPEMMKAVASRGPGSESQGMKDYLASRSVDFPPGADLSYDPSTGILKICNAADEIELIDRIFDGSAPWPSSGSPIERSVVTSVVGQWVTPSVSPIERSVVTHDPGLSGTVPPTPKSAPK